MNNKEVNKMEDEKEKREISNVKITIDQLDVDYLMTFSDKESFIEFQGVLNKYNTGRCEEYEFEPTSFTNEASEEYYEKNWESIEKQILDKFTE